MTAARFYYLHPLLAGPIDTWVRQLDRIAAMRFDAVAIAPPFAAGRSGDLFLTADHARLDERLGGKEAVVQLSRFAKECRDRQLSPMLDLVVDRVAIEHADGLSSWYRGDAPDELPDPRRPSQLPGVAHLLTDGEWVGAVDWWRKQIAQWVDAGINHFRCLHPYLVPGELWRQLITAVRRQHSRVRFIASTAGLESAESEALAGCGFDLMETCSRGSPFRV